MSSPKKLRLRRAFRKTSYFSKSQNDFVELSPPPLSGLAHVAVARRSKLSTHRLIRFLSGDGRAGCVKRKRKKGSGALSPPPRSRDAFTETFHIIV